MELQTAGVVVRSRPYGERDRILTVLTPEYGKISVLARSVGKNKKQSVLYAQLFALSDFVLFKGKGMYVVDSADVKESFYGLRENLSRLALAQYLADVAGKCGEGCDGTALCSLLLNSLYLLGETDVDETVIKLVFEIRYCLAEGVFPEIRCVKCGQPPVRWSFPNGFLCEACGDGFPLTPGMISALKHISESSGKRLYQFSMSEDSARYLSRLMSDYVATVLDAQFPSLDYYRSVRD